MDLECLLEVELKRLGEFHLWNMVRLKEKTKMIFQLLARQLDRCWFHFLRREILREILV